MQNSQLATELYNLLLKYEEYIDHGNDLLKKEYQFEMSPLLARRRKIVPQKGVIRHAKFTFRFHGMGGYFILTEH